MFRKIIAGLLILLSVVFLILSLAGIGAAWYYNEPLTRETDAQLARLDRELALAQATLQSSEEELQRALRFVDTAEAALQRLTQQSQSADNLFENIQSTLDDQLLPELKTTRTRINEARSTLEELQTILAGVSRFLPGVDLSIPDSILADLIASASSLDGDIASMEVLATQASTFVSDTSYLLGGDLTETRTSLENFIIAIQDYEKRVARWREQAADLRIRAPGWIDRISIGVTIFLSWFALSQFGLLLHGLSLHRGMDPLAPLRRRGSPPNPLIKDERDWELEE
jgi:multidrug efflux pump subunit AcrA (membrane-fusion protein)